VGEGREGGEEVSGFALGITKEADNQETAMVLLNARTNHAAVFQPRQTGGQWRERAHIVIVCFWRGDGKRDRKGKLRHHAPPRLLLLLLPRKPNMQNVPPSPCWLHSHLATSHNTGLT